MSNVKAAGRTAAVFGVLKWVLVAWYVFSGVATIQVLYQGTDWPVGQLIGIGLGIALVGGVLSWLLVGYLQHSLAMQTLAAEKLTIMAQPVPEIRMAPGSYTAVVGSTVTGPEVSGWAPETRSGSTSVR